MSNRIANIKNLLNRPNTSVETLQRNGVMQRNTKSPSFWISPVTFERIRHDVKMWREAGAEAENAWYPQRVRMQRMMMDTHLNEHVDACVKKRKNLTLLRKFKICDSEGNIDDDVTAIFKAIWFTNFQSYVIDAKLYGYNLISLGDVVKDSFPNLSFVKRQNVSPDRLIVARYEYSLTGDKFMEDPYKNWYIYVDTPTETAATPCGFGLFYKIAKTEILLRNNIAQNADHNEMFMQPIRKGRTSKQDEERKEYENWIKNMGSNPWVLLDDSTDELELISAPSSGSAWQTFESFEKRGEQKISKNILGHADAMDSVPGKLGAGDGEDNPVVKALYGIQSEDAETLHHVINNELIPRMINLGFNIREGLRFEYLNDEEKEQFRAREDKSNKVTADIAQTMSNAGLQMDPKYFEERTGIPTTVKEISAPPPPLLIDPIKKLDALKNKKNKTLI
jgi:Protein of unknown function (DUF935)